MLYCFIYQADIKHFNLLFLEIVINDITAPLSDFHTLISTSRQALKATDADFDKVIYSRLVALLVPILVNKASKTKLNLQKFTTHNQV